MTTLKQIIIGLKGMIIGGTMMVPGMSGGSMAMVLGVYDELISSISSFLKNIKKSILFLLIFCAGALIGMLLFAKPLGGLMEKYPVILMYFFMGAVAGSIPMMLRKAKVLKKKNSSENHGDGGGVLRLLKSILYLAIGIVPILLLGLLPKDMLSFEKKDISFYLIMIVAGIVAAIALVLPGISVSHMFLMLGLYEPILAMLNNGISLEWLSMLPLAIGLFAGIFLTTRVLERAMQRHPTPTYLIILGFLIGSIFDVFPGFPTGWEILICIPLFAAGFCIIFFLSRMEERHEAKKEVEASAG